MKRYKLMLHIIEVYDEPELDVLVQQVTNAEVSKPLAISMLRAAADDLEARE